MSTSQRSLVLVLQLLVAVLFQDTSCGKSLRTISVDEYHNLNNTTPGSFVAVYFDNAESRRDHPYFLREFRKAVDLLDSYGVELLMVNCKGLDLNECRETNLYTYKNGIQEDTLGLDTLFSQDSVVANVLQSLLKDEIDFVSEKEQFQEILKAARFLKKSVVISYVTAYGVAEHAVFNKLVFVFADKKKYDFVITTNKQLVSEIEGLTKSKKASGSIAVHVCKDLQDESYQPCQVYKPNQMTTVNTAQLLQLLQLPKYEHLGEDGTTSYDNLPLSVNRAFVFTDGTDVANDNEFNSLTKAYHGSVGFILVDVKKHKDKLSKFGLSENDAFPTAAFLPASSAGKAQPYVELFPDHSIIFSFDNFKHLLGEYIGNPQKQYTYEAMTSSLKTITFNTFEKISSPVDSFLRSHVMVAFCERGSLRSECRDFIKEFRRVVRTFDRVEDKDTAFVHVMLTDGGDGEIGTSKRPYIRLYSGKAGSTDFIVYQRTPDYPGMMEFLEEQTKLSITRLQPSHSDNTPIAVEDKSGEMDEQKQPESQETEESQGDEDTGTEGVDTPPPLEETEDDEVAGSVWRTELPNVPEDKIPSLTDKTFYPTRDKNDLLVVNFFQPWDARSQALLGPYVEAALNLGSIQDIGEYSIRLARVNCFDWTDVCQQNNITTYPTIKLYRKGLDEFIYKGPLDSDNLVKTVLMFKADSPLKLQSQEQVESFLTGKLPTNAGKTSYVSVLGMFSSADGNDIKAFTDAAVQLRGSYVFGLVSGQGASMISSAYGVKAPGILLIKRNDPIRPRSVFDGEFTASRIVDFVKLNSLKSFGELTPMNLPLYHSYRRPLLIAFRATAVDDNTFTPIMEKLADDDSLRHKVFFTWMSLTSNDVNEVILKSYTGSNDVPVLIIVDHEKGVLFQYKNDATLKSVSSWVQRCLSGEENPTNKLKEGRWEPLLEGYDYLTLMEEEEQRRKAKKTVEENEFDDDEGETQEQAGAPIERARQRKPEDFREEEEKRHDEL